MFGRLLGWYTIYTFLGALDHIAAALLNGTRVVGVSQTFGRGVVQGMELRNFRRGRHLYSAWRPSRWASAHILIIYVLLALHLFVECHLVLNVALASSLCSLLPMRARYGVVQYT